MKNPFKKKAAPVPSAPREFCVGKRSTGMTYDEAVQAAEAATRGGDYTPYNAYAKAWPFVIGNGPAEPEERIIYRLIPVAVVKQQPPSVELISPTT